MFGFVAAVLFAIAFVLEGTATKISNAWFSSGTLVAAGLMCLALHLCGVGAGFSISRRS